jgi:hypothetical protein
MSLTLVGYQWIVGRDASIVGVIDDSELDFFPRSAIS